MKLKEVLLWLALIFVSLLWIKIYVLAEDKMMRHLESEEEIENFDQIETFLTKPCNLKNDREMFNM